MPNQPISFINEVFVWKSPIWIKNKETEALLNESKSI